ncbi:MAG: carbohydrate kinase family protein [Clostridiales bacterium]|nr:carbohydrate kinase family protein [Clostridiales bacterium]
MTGKGITVAGSLIADNYYLIDSYPEQGKLTNIRATDRAVGGTGNLIIDLAKLDANLQVKVSALIGAGSNGRFLRKTLSEYPNIQLQNVVEGDETPVTIVMDAQDSHQRTFFYLPGASDKYDENVIDWEQIDADIFHLEYILLMKKIDEADAEYGTHGAKILHTARERGMKTSIDMVSETSGKGGEIVRAALKYTDYCTINEIEAEMITGIKILQDDIVNEENAHKALRELVKCGVLKWAIIHSPTCGYGIDCESENIVKVPSLHLPAGYIKGSTGAGDAYCSGILYGAYKNQSLEAAMRLATACAACSLSETNGTAGMRSYDEVMKFMKKYQ